MNRAVGVEDDAPKAGALPAQRYARDMFRHQACREQVGLMLLRNMFATHGSYHSYQRKYFDTREFVIFQKRQTCPSISGVWISTVC
jgi:hypothetical protein